MGGMFYAPAFVYKFQQSGNIDFAAFPTETTIQSITWGAGELQPGDIVRIQMTMYRGTVPAADVANISVRWVGSPSRLMALNNSVGVRFCRGTMDLSVLSSGVMKPCYAPLSWEFQSNDGQEPSVNVLSGGTMNITASSPAGTFAQMRFCLVTRIRGVAS
jgi:hypothetical protein